MDAENAVAIVGIACRFPGADDVDEFWKLLENGECHIKPVPLDRWDLNDTNINDPDESWKDYTRHAGLIHEHDKWDNKFFGVSDTEASWMNPQQCLALEVTHSALENGGFTKTRMKGTNTGVYIGIMNDDMLLSLHNARAEFNNFIVTGIAPSITANRISYNYDLRGPSITLDTACSSALVSVHLGCQAIRTGECDMAICGGVNSILSPLNFLPLSKAKMTSPTGRSHAFSEDADGYTRGEGCGIVILKQYKKAIEDGDLIFGLVATGCNQDGHTNTPITAPSSMQQQSLLKMVYTRYKIDPALVQHIEAHGTGTPVGDPIEVGALATFFASHLQKDQTIPIGSVKTNIGHLESSAGTAGLIKSILMMTKGKIVKTLHFEDGKGNPKINFDNIPLRVSTSSMEWRTHPEGYRLCCVNSFGFGGTNCHAVVEQIKDAYFNHGESKNDYFVVCISGASIPAVQKTVMHLRQKVLNDNYKLSDLAYTSLMRRDQYMFRMTYVASNCSELVEEIDIKKEKIEHLVPVDLNKSKLIFLFCGVGTLWKGTCAAMLNAYDTFRTTFMAVDKELQKYADFSILQDVQKQRDDLSRDPLKGPLIIFACQVALFHTWADLGLRPDAIIGQSVGEVAAAYAAGCLNFENAVKVIYYRSSLSSNALGGGMMLIGKCDVQIIEQMCQKYEDKICIAVYSSDEACLVSGDKDCIDELKTELGKSMPHVRLKELDVGCAYHSYHMEEASTAIQEKLVGLTGDNPITAIFSTMTGMPVVDSSMSTPEYWTNNIRKPVLMKDAVSKAVAADKSNVILELGPRPVIRAHLKNITNSQATSIPSLDQPNELKNFKYAIAELHQRGFSINWLKLFPGQYNLTDIPRYKFDRTGILMRSNALKEGIKTLNKGKDTHPFIKQKALTKQFSVNVSKSTTPYVFEHLVGNRNIAPGAIHAEIAFEKGKQILHLPKDLIDISLEFIRPLYVGKSERVTLETIDTEDEYTFEVTKRQDVICKVKVQEARKCELGRVNISDLKPACQKHKTAVDFYAKLKQLGFQYGECLKVINDCWVSETHYIAEMNLQNDYCNDYLQLNLHPIVLDGALQTIALCYFAMQDKDSTKKDEKPIPVKIRSLIARRPLEQKMLILGRLIKSTPVLSVVDIMIVNQAGDVLVEIEGYEVRNRAYNVQPTSLNDKLYKLRWHPLKVEDVNIESNEQILYIVLSSEASAILETYMGVEKKYISCLPFKSERYDANALFQELQSFIHTVFQGLVNIEKILFFPGLTCFSENQDSGVIFNMVKTSCVLLTELIKQLLNDNIDIPVYILTKQTQPKSDIDSVEHCSFSVVGSELWGMCRCLARERTFSRLLLIDFEHDEDTSLVHTIMTYSKSERWKQPREYKLDGNLVFINQITRASADEPQLKMNSYNKHEAVDIRTKHPSNTDNLFMVPLSQDNDLDSPKSIELEVADIYMNDVWIPLTKTKATEDPDPWKYRRKDGHQILPCEMTGYISARTTGSSTHSAFSFTKSTVSAVNGRRKKFGTIFPTSCSNIYVLPDDCILDLSHFPTYTPGMLTEAVMYFSLAENLKEKLQLVILYDEDLHLNTSLLRSIMEFNKQKFDTLAEIGDITGLKIAKKCQVVLLSKNALKTETMLKLMKSKIDKITTFTSFMPKAIERQTRLLYPNLQFQVIDTDAIGSRHTLPKYFKKVKSWLSSKTTKRHWKNNMNHEKRFSEGEHLITFVKDVENERHLINANSLHKSTTRECLFSKNATYVIIGGLSGLGWEMVHLIAKMGGGGIAILSRGSPNEEQQTDINNIMGEFHCKIEHIATDISELSSVKEAFTTINARFPNQMVKGVFHGAAVVDDSIILYMTEDKIDKVLRPKILGTWNLHLASKDLNLDYFVLHSSVTSAFGNSGQTNYGAGNSFQDTTAYFRRSIGLAGQTINWGPLKLGLLEKNKHVEKHLSAQGYNSMNKDELIECLLHTLTANSVQEIWGLFDWEKIVGHAADMVHLTSRVNLILAKLNLNQVFTSQKNNISYVYHEELLKQSPNNQRKTIMNIIRCITAEVCAVDTSVVQQTSRFTHLGMDSLKGMSFIDAVYEHISCRIPVISVIDDESSVESVSNLILDQIHAGNEKGGFFPVKKIQDEEKKEDPVDKWTEKSDDHYRQYEVLHETQKGGTRKVKLWICKEDGINRLYWSTENGKEHLNLKERNNMKFCAENGHKVISFQKLTEKIKFKSENKELMNTIWKEMEEVVKSVDTHVSSKIT